MGIEKLTSLILAIAFLIFTIMIVGGLLVGYILAKISEKKYKLAIIKIILDSSSRTNEAKLESIKNTYQNYRINGSFSYLGILEINSKLIAELRDDTYKKYYKNSREIVEEEISRLEDLNKYLRDEFYYSDEKLNNVLSEIRTLSTDIPKVEKSCTEVKLLYSALISYCDGRIFEKQNEIYQKDVQLRKMQANRWISRIGWIIGVVSGVLTIISAIK